MLWYNGICCVTTAHAPAAALVCSGLHTMWSSGTLSARACSATAVLAVLATSHSPAHPNPRWTPVITHALRMWIAAMPPCAALALALARAALYAAPHDTRVVLSARLMLGLVGPRIPTDALHLKAQYTALLQHVGQQQARHGTQLDDDAMLALGCHTWSSRALALSSLQGALQAGLVLPMQMVARVVMQQAGGEEADPLLDARCCAVLSTWLDHQPAAAQPLIERPPCDALQPHHPQHGAAGAAHDLVVRASLGLLCMYIGI